MSLPIGVYFVILVVAFALLLTERLRNDLVAVLIVVSLALTGLLKPDEALAGFSSEPAIVVAGIFVLSAALHQTGLSEIMGVWIGRLAGRSYSRILLVVMPSVAVLSAFTHHVTTTAIMLPVLMNLSRERQIPASKLLMPLSFAASLGTTITIIGAPAFLIASGLLEQAGRPGLAVFSIAPVGIALSVAGTAFMLLVGRFLLPDRQGVADPTGRFELGRYLTEVAILPNSPFVGRSPNDLRAQQTYDLNVVGWVRDGRSVDGPHGDRALAPGDVLQVRATPDEIVTIRHEAGLELHAAQKYERAEGNEPVALEDLPEHLLQAVVAPNSDLVNRTIAEVNFRQRYGAIVLGLWRRRANLRGALARVRLREGDVLVLQGEDDALTRVANERRDFLMMVPFQGELRQRRRAPLAALIMLGTIAAAAFGTPLQIAALAGAAAVVLTGCLTPRQAYRAIDQRIFVFIAGAIPLGTAMTKTGASDLLAGWLRGAVGALPELAVLLVIFAIVGILTQFMSDSATTALFGPIAVALAQGLGRPPEAFVVTVAMASVVAFLTPIGHHGNLLVYGPGGYQFADFVRVGTPLTVLCGIVACVMAMQVWG